MDPRDKGTPGKFLSNFLSNPGTSIPKGAQWAVYFDDLKRILRTVEQAYKGEPRVWNTKEAGKILASPQFQQSHGCLFCQAIDLPGEGMTPVAEGIKSNAFIRSYIGAGRNDFPIMRMSFLETNVSFADSLLRGWALATAKFGMIARTGNKNYRTNLTCYKFSMGPGKPHISQTMRFEGICCISLSNEESNYDAMTSITRRDAQFIYNSYSIDTVTGINPAFLNTTQVDNPTFSQVTRN
jgi:hypothetical protein